MAEFEAKITGIADLSKAKQDFDAFKKSMEQPIKITIDTSGFNVVWGNLQKQVQQFGVASARQFNKGFESTLKTDFGHEASKKIISGWNAGDTSKNIHDIQNQTSALRDELGASLDVIRRVQEEIDNLNLKGLKLEKFKFNDTGDRFTAKAVGEMGQLVDITGRWRDAVKDASGEISDPAHWEIIKTATVDFTAGLKEARAEAERVAKSVSMIGQNVSNGDFTKQIAKMNADISNIGKDVPKADISKVVKAATEYAKITTNITASVNGKSANPLQGQDLVNAYAQAQNALKAYNNALAELTANAKASGIETGNAVKQTQAEVDKLAKDLEKVGKAFIHDDFSANIATMNKQLSEVSDTVDKNLVQKATDAANEYKRISTEIMSSLDGTSKNPLQGRDLVNAYKESEDALKSYRNAMKEVRADTTKMFAEGANTRAANDVEAWAKKNSRALKQYGTQLEELAQQMRDAKTAGELDALQNKFKNLKSEINAVGLGGLTFGDQIKKAFVHIGEFTGIYALTSQIRQLPREMVQEVIKIDTAMTELRKVSTASASEITNYFDQAADSAMKYGQTIDGIIESTASWTRLGYELKDATTLSDVTAELAQVGSGLNVDTATEGLQATIRGFGLAADEAKRVGDMINYIADTEPIDALGIINGLERSSAAMSEANNSLEETIGLITATTSVTQDAASAGNAWRTISMRIRGAKTELEEAGEDTSGMVESVSKLRSQVMALSGVDILEADEKTFKSTTQIVRELAQVYDKMEDIDQANLLELLAGKRGANVLAAALQNWDIVEDTIKGATTESVGSMDQQLEVYNQSIQASLDKFHVAFQELSADVLGSGFIKGIVDAGTTIIKIIDGLVKHIGVLGTAITGLGIAKTFSIIKSGITNLDDIGDAFSLFSPRTIKNVGDLKIAFSTLWEEVSIGAEGASNAFIGLLSNISPLTLGIGAGIAGAFALYKVWKGRQEEIQRNTSNATTSWNSSKGEIEQYKERYAELNEQLNDANITESQRISIKQQLLDLQNEINSKYGEQAGKIDLVNGSLETQLALLTNISAEEAKRNIRENYQGYEKARSEMQKTRTYRVKNPNVDTGEGTTFELSESAQEAYNKIFDNKFWKNEYGSGTFVFRGDASQFDSEIQRVMDELEDLRDTVGDSDKNLIQTAINNAQREFSANQKILDEHLDNYRAYMQQKLYADGFGDELAEYAKRTQEYNDALFSGDAEKINEAKVQLDEYKGTVSEITSAHEEYGNFFDEVANSVEKTTERVYQFSDIIKDGIADSSNDLAKYQSEIFSAVNNIKALGLDGVDVQDILLHGGVGFEDLSALAKIYDPNFDFKEDTVRGFADFLAQLGVVAGGAGDGIDLAKESFDGFMKSASESIETIDKVNSALVNAFASGGLSMGVDKETGALTGDVATIMSAYKDLESYNPERLFERTADGIIVNTKALREMRAEQERTMKSEFEKRIQEAQENLNKAIESGNASEIQAWKTRLQNVKLLSTAYDGATSAYQKWLDAQKGGEMGDQYDTVVDTALKRGKELYDQGLVGTNEFRALAQLYSGEDLSTASIDDVVKAYEDGVGVVKKYFTEGQKGAVAFADKLVDLELATKDAQGNYDFSEGIDTQELADELGMSVDLVEAAFKKLNDYGFDIHFVSPETAEALSEINERATEAQDTLKNLANEEGKIGNLDVSSAINLDVNGLDTVQECDDALNELSENVPDPKVNPAAYEAFRDLIDEIQKKRDLLTGDTAEVPINFDTLSAGFSKMDELQQRIRAIGEMNEQPGIDLSVEGDEKVQQLSEEIANLPEDMKVSLGFEANDDASAIVDKLEKQTVTIPVQYQQPTNDLSTSATVRADFDSSSVTIPDQTVHVDAEPNPIDVVAKLDSTAVDEYTPKEIPELTVTYGKESSEVDNYNPPNFDRNVNYDINVYGASAVDDLPSSGSRYITYYINTVGSPPAYKGTVPNSAFRGMSHVGGTAHANGLNKFGLKQDENALINEVGAEIVVRPSEDSWMIFNGGKPTMGAPLKKGDIIFNAQQTKELLSKGWTNNYANIFGNSFANGTIKGSAHATAIGGGRFKKATSSSKSSSGGGGGGGNNNGGGGGDNSKANKEAKDFKETLDKIEIRIDRLDRMISNFDTVASNVFNNLTTRSDALSKSLYVVGTEIKEQQRAYNRYIKQANKVGLDSKLAAKVRKGEIDIQDIKNEDTWKKIEEYRKWYEAALDARDAVYKLKADEADLWNQRFELNQTNYENQIAQYQHLYDQLDNYISLAENTGRISANKLRLRQIDEENKKISKLKTEYNSLKTIMDKAVASGKIKINSEGYYEMLSTLNDISESIVETTANIEELNKSIRETNWEIFDKGAETISNVRDELEFLYGLLGDEDKMYDEKGVVTSNGVAGFGILSAQYNVAMQEAQKYASEIKKINQELAKDPYNQDLIERRQELYESQRQSIEDANNYKESIVDLVENGIKKQIDSLKDLISKYTDLMDAQKDEIDYAKKVADAQNNVNKIQKQLNAYANDDTEEGASRRQKLRNDLKNAQDTLAQTEEERRMSQTKKLLSDLQEEYENILNARLDDVDALIQAVVDGVNVNSSVIVDAIKTASNDVGYIMTEATSTMFNSSTVKDLASYFVNGKFVESVTGIADGVKLITNYYSSAQKDADRREATNIMAERVRSSGTHIQSYTDGNGNKKVGYFKEDGTLDKTHTGWANKDGKIYRFENGQMVSGSKLIDVGGKKYYLDKDGSRVSNVWRNIGGKLYHFNKNGEAETGLVTINGKQFYFDKNGVNKKGLQSVGGSKYYFDTKSGAMIKNAWRQADGGLYHFGSNGKAASGWMKTDSGKWFFFDPKTNKRVVSQWIHNGAITTKPVKGDYYVGADGVRVVNGKKKTNRGYLTFDANGKWKGYKSGVRSVPSNGMYWTNEGAPETIIRKSDGAILTRLNTNDTVLNNNATQNMWDFANNPQKFLRGLGVNNTYGSGNNVNLEFNLSGLRSPSEFMDALRKDKRFEKLIQEMTLGRVNGHGSLAKNAIRV